jgi:hypothetical protein
MESFRTLLVEVHKEERKSNAGRKPNERGVDVQDPDPEDALQLE